MLWWGSTVPSSRLQEADVRVLCPADYKDGKERVSRDSQDVRLVGVPCGLAGSAQEVGGSGVGNLPRRSKAAAGVSCG